MTIEILVEEDFLRANQGGEFSLQAAQQIFLETLEAAIEHRSRKVLIDGRGVTGKIETMERFQYGAFVANAVINSPEPSLTRTTRYAYVLEPPILDPQRHGETVAINRGMNVRVFDNLEDALRWLKDGR